MMEVVIVDGQARGIICRNLVTGEIEKYSAQAVLLCTGGYSNVYFLSTNAMNCNTTAIWRAHKKGAYFANPCYTQIHPTCLPLHGESQSKLALMSESLRNDGRIWVPQKAGETRKPNDIPENERDYYLERKYPSFGNLSPRDISSRSAKEVCDEGRGVDGGEAVYLDFADAINRFGKHVIEERYGNLFEIYEAITGDNPYDVPMKIYPAPHYTMGGLWVDYNLMSTIPGLFVLGEANFSDHGANRLGASALMQGLADGYFVAPYTVSNYLASEKPEKVDVDNAEFNKVQKEVEDLTKKLLSVNGNKTVDEIHKKLGRIMWNKVGMARNENGLKEAIDEIKELREDFWKNVKVVGVDDDINQTLERAGRLLDYLELGELMAVDALDRKESCGGHFREEYQTEEGEALRNDNDYTYVSAWQFEDVGKWQLNKEPLDFEYVKLATRSYK
jgi:succinate dehydrogenase / fumarate reductase flavoprotein subunit